MSCSEVVEGEEKSGLTGGRGTGYRLIRDLLKWMGQDPDDPGLAETPRRVVDAWRELLSCETCLSPARSLCTTGQGGSRLAALKPTTSNWFDSNPTLKRVG